jgi:hypothetical protein
MVPNVELNLQRAVVTVLLLTTALASWSVAEPRERSSAAAQPSAVGQPLAAPLDPAARDEMLQLKDPRLREHVDKKLREARQAEMKGDLDQSVKLLREVHAEVQRREDAPEALMQVQFQEATALRRAASDRFVRQKDEAARRQDAERAGELLRQIGDRGTPRQQALAKNQLGILELAGPQPDPRAAIKSFRSVELEQLAGDERLHVQFNLGRAYQDSGDQQQAYEQFRNILREKPDFQPAVEGAFRALRSDGRWARPSTAAELTKDLIEERQIGLARENLWTLLPKAATQGEASLPLFNAMIQLYAAASVPPDEYKQVERDKWQRMQGRSDAWDRQIQNLDRAYLGELMQAVRGQNVLERFPGVPARKDFATLLKSIGDAYTWSEEPAKALSRYYAAWMMDRDNTSAALYAASILQDHRELDPDGALLEALIREAFHEKAVAYGEQDWLNIRRLHVLLAGIFEREFSIDDAAFDDPPIEHVDDK